MQRSSTRGRPSTPSSGCARATRGLDELRSARNSALILLLGGYAIQCAAGGDNNSGGAANGGGGSGAKAGGINVGLDGAVPDHSPDDFFATDPPPLDCSDSGVPVKVPGGTPECPDDKAYQGCPCPAAGVTAACWPGLRKNRNKGDCKDGITICNQSAEFTLAWGPCEGYQGISPPTYLPPDGATGKAACQCFSGGYWDVKNLVPCLYDLGGTMGGVSSIPNPSDPTDVRCPEASEINLVSSWSTTTAPANPFSPNSLTVDCNGYFELCFALKAFSAIGAPMNSATDCQVMQVCTDGYYDLAGKGPNGTDGEKSFADLPSWITKTDAENACAQAFVDNGGYGEFSVKGTSDECDTVDKLFLTFEYCPMSCGDPNPPAECASCTNGAGASF